MNYRNIGKSELKVSEVSLGSASATFVGKADEKASIAIINHALDLGINYIDTAETYAEGRAELLIGKALEGKRSQVVIATKFGKDRSVAPGEQRGSYSHIMEAIEDSLKRLVTDYIDLYIMHEPDPLTPIEETLLALTDLVKAGKVRYIGCSDFAASQIAEAISTSKEHNLESFIMAGATYSLIYRECEQEFVPCCLAAGIGVIPIEPLAKGFLTGKYRRGQVMPPGSRFSVIPPFVNARFQNPAYYNRFLSSANFDKLDKLEIFANERGCTTAELAIAWLLSHPWLGTVLTGVSSADQLTKNVAAADLKLSKEDIVQLDKIT